MLKPILLIITGLRRCFHCGIFVNGDGVFHFLMFFFKCKLIINSVKFGLQGSHLCGIELPTLLADCSFCGCFIVFSVFSFGVEDLMWI